MSPGGWESGNNWICCNIAFHLQLQYRGNEKEWDKVGVQCWLGTVLVNRAAPSSPAPTSAGHLQCGTWVPGKGDIAATVFPLVDFPSRADIQLLAGFLLIRNSLEWERQRRLRRERACLEFDPWHSIKLGMVCTPFTAHSGGRGLTIWSYYSLPLMGSSQPSEVPSQNKSFT